MIRFARAIIISSSAATLGTISSCVAQPQKPTGTLQTEVIAGPLIYTANYKGPQKPDSIVRGCEYVGDSHLSMVIGVVEFKDDATFAEPSQLPGVLQCIAELRRRDSNGVVVLAFAHGWHHNADWDVVHDSGDTHFKAFRRIMMSLALREAERGLAARRVVGVFLGWRGQTADGPLRTRVDPRTFWSRLNTAERIGNGIAIRKAMVSIIDTTKGEVFGAFNRLESPLVFAGHSMGALMIETALLSMLRSEPDSVLKPSTRLPEPCATVRRGTKAVQFPDLVLLLNAATDSRIAQEMSGLLQKERLSRDIQCPPYSYSGPVVVSVTSEKDMATKTLFPLGRPGHKSEGHDASVFTHSLVRLSPGATCSPKGPEHIMVSFNQAWHCLRSPEMNNGQLTSIALDLPQGKKGEEGNPCHVRYRIKPIRPLASPAFWIFQVPGDVIGGHSDVFNARSNLFVMALAQASGGVLSLAGQWTEVFEREEQPCTLSG